MDDSRNSQLDGNTAPASPAADDFGTSGKIRRQVSPIGHLHCIDFLRGVASLAIVVIHASHANSYGTKSGVIARLHHLLEYCNYGVPLFFVISGFCIHRKQAELSAAGLDDTIPFRKYWKRRFFRLYPSYFVVCVGSALLMLGAIASGSSSTLVSNYPGNPYFYLSMDFLTHILLIHSFFPMFDRSLGNGPLWTLAREEQYYLLYSPLLKLKKYVGVWTCLLLTMIVSYATIRLSESVSLSDPGLGFIIETSSLAYWPQWVLGMIGMELLVNRGRSIALCGHRAALLVALPIIVWQKEIANPPWLNVLMLGIAFFLIVTSFSKMEIDGRWIRTKCIRCLEAVGQYSYSLYLVNYPVLVILGKLARHMGSNENLLMYLVFMAIGIAISNLAGYSLYYLVERHGQRKPVES